MIISSGNKQVQLPAGTTVQMCLQALDAFPGKFQRLIEGTIDANLTNQCQNDILPADTGRFLTGQFDFDGLRHLEPGFARSHCRAQIR